MATISAPGQVRKPVNVDTIRVGDTVEIDGLLKTVCPGDIKSGFMGVTLFGDSYRLGTVPVIKVEFVLVEPGSVSHGF